MSRIDQHKSASEHSERQRHITTFSTDSEVTTRPFRIGRRWQLQELCALLFVVSAVSGVAGEDDVASRVSDAALSTETYQLIYKFQPGEIVTYEVEQLATVDTRIAGNSQESKTRTASTKSWKITDVTEQSVTLEQTVLNVDAWQKTDGRQEVRYNSKTDTEVPPDFQRVADLLNKRQALVTIDLSGRVLKRESNTSAPDLGFGSMVLPLPREAVELGYSWDVPDSVRLQERDGRSKLVKTRIRYTLQKVSVGVATISMKTQILTPLNNAQLEAQLVQKISNGEIKFDIDAGRVISKHLDWDETVIGFNGPGSNMKYLARFTEKLAETKTASKRRQTN